MIALGCDHGGYELMQEVIAYLDEKGLEYKNFGCGSTDAVCFLLTFARNLDPGKNDRTGRPSYWFKYRITPICIAHTS